MNALEYDRLRFEAQASRDAARRLLAVALGRGDERGFQQAARRLGFGPDVIDAISAELGPEEVARLHRTLEQTRGTGWVRFAARPRALLAVATTWFESVVTRAQVGLFDGSALHADLWSLEHASWCELLRTHAERPEAAWFACRVLLHLRPGQRAYAQRYFRFLAELFDERLAPPVVAMLEGARPAHRRIPLAWLVARDAEVPEAVLWRALRDPSRSVRELAIERLARSPRVAPRFLRALGSRSPRLRATIAELAARVGSTDSVPALLASHTAERCPKVRARLEEALRASGSPRFGRVVDARSAADLEAELAAEAEPRLPGWLDLDALPRLAWRAGGALGGPALRRLVDRLTRLSADHKDRELEHLVGELEAEGARRFGVALVTSLEGRWPTLDPAARKASWGWVPFAALALGGEAALDPLASFFERGVAAACGERCARPLFVALELSGSDLALVWLDRFRQTAARASLRRAAQEAYARIARGRGLSAAEAWFRSLPRHGLDGPAAPVRIGSGWVAEVAGEASAEHERRRQDLEATLATAQAFLERAVERRARWSPRALEPALAHPIWAALFEGLILRSPAGFLTVRAGRLVDHRGFPPSFPADAELQPTLRVVQPS